VAHTLRVIGFDAYERMNMTVRLMVDKRVCEHESQTITRERLNQGLLDSPARVPPRYLYDALGSRLFAAITELPEYYLTRTESGLLDKYSRHIAALVSGFTVLVDLGAGDCKKVTRLLPLLRPSHYLAIDVSGECLRAATQSLAQDFPGIQISALITDFSEGIRWPEEMRHECPLFFYLGSSIGNFSSEDAHHFLRNLYSICRDGHEGRGMLLIGVDLLKPAEMLEAAYDDALGLTACFNLNVLQHLNAILGADFKVRNFRHRAIFDARHRRVEMSLVSRCAQTVRWSAGQRRFNEGEAIITEYSHKYTTASFERLLRASGFAPLGQWTDEHGHYLLCLATAIR
jgi:dimethylhistidine N-methyltransferase